MKNVKVILSGIICLLLLNSCQLTNQKVKIALLFGDFSAPRWKKEKVYFEEQVAKLGGEVMFGEAERDELKQYEQAAAFIEQGANIIVIQFLNANTGAAIVRLAHRKGVKVVAYESFIDRAELDYSVGFDLEKIGQMQAQYLVARKPGGNYVIFNGDRSSAAAFEINRGAMNILKPYIDEGKINVVFNTWVEEWSAINSSYYYNLVHKLSLQEIDAVIAASDIIAEGVTSAIKEDSITNKILITGQDGELSACKRIYKGEQSMTIYKSSETLAKAAANLAFNVVTGGKVEGLVTKSNGKLDVPCLLIEPIVVDKDNLYSTIVASNVYTANEIEN